MKTLAGVQKLHNTFLERMFKDETDAKPRSLTARDMTFDQVVEIFGLKVPVQEWKHHGEIYDTPRFLTLSLAYLEKALYDKGSEAYCRIAVDYLIVACMVKHRKLQSKQFELPTDQFRIPANNPTAATSPILEQSKLPTNDQTATIVPILDQATEIARPSYIAPTTPLVAPKSTPQPLPIKVFPEMALSVYVKRGGREWHISGIADWAMGYGDRATLEDGAVLLAVEAKRRKYLFDAEAQLLAYLATIRQLRIQANKKNVMTQGFYSDGESYKFLCICNNGTVMKSVLYDTSLNRKYLQLVFNFLLSMLATAAESLLYTSPVKPGPEQDKRIENFDQEVFVEVFEDIGADNISIPTSYYVDEMEEDELSDVIIEEE
jgi:hypothetical protein